MNLSPSVWGKWLASVALPGQGRDASQVRHEGAEGKIDEVGERVRGNRRPQCPVVWNSIRKRVQRRSLLISHGRRSLVVNLYLFAAIVACSTCECTEIVGEFVSEFPRAPRQDRFVHSQFVHTQQAPQYWPPSDNGHVSMQPPPEQGSLAHILMPGNQRFRATPSSPVDVSPALDPTLYDMPQFQQFGMPGFGDTVPEDGYDSLNQDANLADHHGAEDSVMPDWGVDGLAGPEFAKSGGNSAGAAGHDGMDDRWTLISQMEMLRHRGRYSQRGSFVEEDVSPQPPSTFPGDGNQMTVYNRYPVHQVEDAPSNTWDEKFRKDDVFDDRYNNHNPPAYASSAFAPSSSHSTIPGNSPQSYLTMHEDFELNRRPTEGAPADFKADVPMELAKGSGYPYLQTDKTKFEFPASSVSPRSDLNLNHEERHMSLPFDHYYLDELEEDVSRPENLSEQDEVFNGGGLTPPSNLLAVAGSGGGLVVQNRLKKEMRWLISTGSRRGSAPSQVQSPQAVKESMKKTFLTMRRNHLSITDQGFAEPSDEVKEIDPNANMQSAVQIAADHEEGGGLDTTTGAIEAPNGFSKESLDEVQRFKLGEMLKEMQRSFDHVFHQRRASNRTVIERSIYDIIMYNSMMHAQAGAARAGHASAEDGFAILNRMVDAGVTPTYMTFYKLLELIEGASGYGSSNITHAEMALERMKAEGIGKDAGIYRLHLGIIAGLASMGRSSVAQAYIVIQNMRNDGICEGEEELKLVMKIAVSSSRHGQSSSKDAHRVIDRMKSLYLTPDLEMYLLAMQVHVYSAAWGFATLSDAERLIEQAQELGFSHHPALYNAFFQVASATAAHNQASLHECEKVLDKMSQHCKSPPSTRLFGDAFQIYALEAKNGRASVEDGIRLLKRLEDAHGRNVLGRLTPRRSRSKGRVLREEEDELSGPARSRSSEQLQGSLDRKSRSKKESLPQFLTPSKDIAKSRRLSVERRTLEKGLVGGGR
mmetsp:Transcript_24656/g.55717  ORF Transcript_24656/g.55717 Transcript_24656/m.55717 type:complete len:984 (-) Transcript_24656:79-3030(-)